MSSDYEILDSGEGRKLERVGPYVMDRQCAVAFWRKSLPATEWKKAQAVHQRSDKGGGHWDFKAKFPEAWPLNYGQLQLKIKMTSFGHLGFFAEQIHEWKWFRDYLGQQRLDPPPKVLNLFGYTGGSSLSCALAGAHVTHVDAAKGVVDWGRENAELNKIPAANLRWIVEDAMSFLKREARRGNRYDAIILDPPSFGRGPKKEVFKLEEDANELLDDVFAVLSENAIFLHMSCHTPGFSPQVLENLLAERCRGWAKHHASGEMTVRESRGRKIPSGVFCRFYR